jgi:hypothetical protein
MTTQTSSQTLGGPSSADVVYLTGLALLAAMCLPSLLAALVMAAFGSVAGPLTGLLALVLGGGVALAPIVVFAVAGSRARTAGRVAGRLAACALVAALPLDLAFSVL